MKIRRLLNILFAHGFCPAIAVLIGGMIMRLLTTGITGRYLQSISYMVITPLTCIALFFMLRGIQANSKKIKVEDTLVHKHPDTPWQWREDWKSGYCAYSSYPVIRTLWSITAVFCAGTAMKVETFRIPPPPDYFWMKMWPFFAGCILLFILASYATHLWSKYGTCALRLFSVPILPNKELAGVIQTAHKIPMHDGYILKLQCKQSQRLIYQNAILINDIADVPHQTDSPSIPLLLKLPDAMPDSREAHWELMLYSQRFSFRLFRCKFLLPVFDAPASWSSEHASTPEILQNTFNSQQLENECFRK